MNKNKIEKIINDNTRVKASYESLKPLLNFNNQGISNVATKSKKSWLYITSLSLGALSVIFGLTFGLVFGLQKNVVPNSYAYAKLLDKNEIEAKHYSLEEAPVALKKEGLYDLTDFDAFAPSVSILLKSKNEIEEYISTYEIASSQYRDTLLSYNEDNFADKALLTIISYDRKNETVHADDILLIYNVSNHLPQSMFISMIRTEDTSDESIFTYIAEVDSKTVSTINNAVYAFNVS